MAVGRPRERSLGLAWERLGLRLPIPLQEGLFSQPRAVLSFVQLYDILGRGTREAWTVQSAALCWRCGLPGLACLHQARRGACLQRPGRPQGPCAGSALEVGQLIVSLSSGPRWGVQFWKQSPHFPSPKLRACQWPCWGMAEGWSPRGLSSHFVMLCVSWRPAWWPCSPLVLPLFLKLCTFLFRTGGVVVAEAWFCELTRVRSSFPPIKGRSLGLARPLPVTTQLSALGDQGERGLSLWG